MANQVIGVTAATDEWMSSFMGEIRLDTRPSAVDLRRVAAGQMRLHIDHDVSAPVGLVTSLAGSASAVTGRAELIVTENSRAAIDDINAQLKSGLSFGFLVLSAKLLKEGESGYKADVFRMIIEKWEPYELSAVSGPRGVRSRITSGLRAPNTASV